MSLINNEQSQHVKFISYSGEYPNLCRGTLKLEINGVEYCFHEYNDGTNTKNEDGTYKRFWSSGGVCEFWGGSGHTSTGEWIIDVFLLPEHLREYATEIDVVFNKNVDWGCCGGCV